MTETGKVLAIAASIIGVSGVLILGVTFQKPVSAADLAKDRLAKCQGKLPCFAAHYDMKATTDCKRPIERMASNNFEWTNGYAGSIFSGLRWRDEPKLVVTFLGDKIKFQNGFGAWIIHTYECDYDTIGSKVADYRVRSGQLSIR